MDNIVIYSDGACKGNPGRGGYGTLVFYPNDKEVTLTMGYRDTTNNRMELLGVIKGIESIQEKSIIDIYTDSQYVVNAFNKRWIVGWEKNNWIKWDKKPVKNKDLWVRLLKAVSKHEVRFHWVKGHADNIYNNRCDTLAVNSSNDFNNLGEDIVI